MSQISQRILILAGVLTVLSFKGALGIMCYHCNSEFDPRCGDPFDDYSLGHLNCSMKPSPDHLQNPEAVVCRKITQKVYGKTRVLRDCGYIRDDRDDRECVKRLGTHDVQALYCACTTDLCNSAPTTILSNKDSNIFMKALPLALTL
ncbi:unnamed protein product [Hermetia illucens]|uniref:Protein sleepless n=1 Tax=Hermetia illucens TaxID=343691 RepID=A0A7R8UUX1_HERIL|nr:unnamed protein product [Hermetia illucens]